MIGGQNTTEKNFIKFTGNDNLKESVKYLKFLGKEINSFTDEVGNTPLHWAVRCGSSYLINFIFEKMTKLKLNLSLENLPKNNLGHTALQEAIMFASPFIQYSFAEYLLKNKHSEIFMFITREFHKNVSQSSLANIFLKSLSDPDKKILLKKTLEIAPFFLNNSNVNNDNLLTLTLQKSKSLFKAVLHSPFLNPKLINTLYSNFNNLNCALYAAYSQDFNSLKLLLNHDNFDSNTINLLDNSGQSLLLHVLTGPKDEKLTKKLAEILITKGIEINIAASNNEYMSVLLFYFLSMNYNKEQHFPIVDFLIKYGGKFSPQNENLDRIFKAIFYNQKKLLKSFLKNVTLECNDHSSFMGSVLAMNIAILIALRNHNFSLINEVKVVLDKIYDHCPERFDSIKCAEYIISNNIKLRNGFTKHPENKIKAKVLNEIANIFIDKNVYMQAFKKLEELLEITLSPQKISKLKKLQFTSLNHMGYTLPFKETTDKDIKINNEFTKVIYAILQKHGFEIDELFYFAGFVPETKANKIATESLFQESIKNTSILHGIKSHILQMVVMCILIDLKLIKTPHQFNGRDIINIIINEDSKFEYSYCTSENKIFKLDCSLWGAMFDRFSWFYSSKNNIIFSPHILNMILMNEAEELPIISTLMKRTFVHKLQTLCGIVNDRGYDENIIPKQAIYAMMASKNDFSRCDFGITFEELKSYYEHKQKFNINRDVNITFKGVRDRYIIITKESKSFVEDVAERRILYESTLDEQNNQNSLSV